MKDQCGSEFWFRYLVWVIAIITFVAFAGLFLLSCLDDDLTPSLPLIQAGQYRATFVEPLSATMILVASPVDKADLLLHGKSAVWIWTVRLPCLHSPMLGPEADRGRAFWKERLKIGDDIVLVVSKDSPRVAALPVVADVLLDGKRMSTKVLAAGLAEKKEGCGS